MTVGVNFSEQGYKNLICAFLDMGYVSVDFSVARADARQLILRHDIDMSLAAAAILATIEQQLEVKAHYFVLVSSEFYNIFTSRAAESLGKIHDAGHTIGLHFDAAKYSPEEIDVAAARELTALESVIGEPIEMISLHRPNNALVGNDTLICGLPHSYQSKFVHDIGYCSDSRGEWRYGEPLSHKAVKEGKALQLLTHPIWWVGNKVSPSARIDDFLRDRAHELDSELAEHCSIHIADRFNMLAKVHP